MSALPHYGADPDVLRLCTLLRSVLQRETFTSMADLKEACACAIADLSRKNPKHPWYYEGWQLDRAFEIVGASRPLVVQPLRRRVTVPVVETGPPPVRPAEARELLDRYKAQPRTITGGSGSDPSHEARVRQQADQWRGRGDPDAERDRERQTQAQARIAWERQHGGE